MKTPSSKNNDEVLGRVLKEWSITAPLPPRFQDAVWHRIERAERQTFSWRTVLERLTTALARPALASSYVAVLVLAGLLAGYWEAKFVHAHAEAQLSARYVQLVDPYRSLAHRP